MLEVFGYVCRGAWPAMHLTSRKHVSRSALSEGRLMSSKLRIASLTKVTDLREAQCESPYLERGEV